MAYRFALIGFPFSGKTTTLQAACQLGPEHLLRAGNEYGEHVGTVKFTEDDRLLEIAEREKSRKLVYVNCELWDFPGFDLSTEAGRQRARRLVGEVRQCDLLVLVLRAFKDPSTPCYRDRIDPQADLEEMMEEFVFADMDQLTRRIEKLEGQIKKPTPRRDEDKKELELLKRCLAAMEAGESIDELVRTEDEQRMLRGFTLLTRRPCVVIINTDEDNRDVTVDAGAYPMVRSVMTCAAEYERQLEELDASDREAFLADAGIMELIGKRLIVSGFAAMDVIIHYTAGENEARAWEIPVNSKAVDVAGNIHSDIARGFIRAETVSYDDLMACGSIKEAKAAGKLRLEGKDYIVQDGDVILFRFNV